MAIPISRRTALTVFATSLAGVTTGCLGQDWDAFDGVAVNLATGNPGGVFARYGAALATVLDRRLQGVACETMRTDASVQNLRLVQDRAADAGLSLGDTASDAVRGTASFSEPLDVVALARTYDSFVHLVVRADSGIVDVTDLRDRRVGVGGTASGTFVIARRVFRQFGMDLSDVATRTYPLRAAADGIRTNTIDAFFFVSGLPNQAILRLSRDVDIRLLNLDRAVRGLVREHGPEYVDGPVTASTYGLARPTDTVSVKNYVVVHRRMPERLAYALTRVMFEAQQQVDRLAPGVGQPSLGAAIFTSPLDLHPGAVRYYRERRP